MITIPLVVNQIIKSSPLLQEGLSRGLINTSALARSIQPEVARLSKKDVSEAAVVMAIKRLHDNMPEHLKSADPNISAADLIIRSNLIDLTFRNSATLNKKHQRLLSLIADHNQHFLTVTTGVFETTVIASADLEPAILKILTGESLTAQSRQLSSVTVKLTRPMIEHTGTIAQILRQLSWDNINLVEVVSTYQELTIIVNSADADKVLSSLRQT